MKVCNSHTFISGITRSGKTYFATNSLADLPYPVIFFNIQEEDLPKKFIKLNAKDIDGVQLMDALRMGCKIDLRLPQSAAQTNNCVGYVLDLLMNAGFSEKNPVYIGLDECQLLAKYGLDMAIAVATRGLKRGCRAVFISQRPAMVHKTLYTQSSEQYIFALAPSERSYLMDKGLDFDKMNQLWEELGKYSYVYFDGRHYEGRRAV